MNKYHYQKILLSFVYVVPLDEKQMKDVITKGRSSGILLDLPDDASQGTADSQREATGEASDYARNSTERGSKDNEWSTAESFLFGRIRERHLLVKERSVEWPVSIGLGNRNIPCCVVVTTHEQYNVMLITVCATILDSDTGAAFSHHRFDEVIAVLQSFHGAPSVQDPNAEDGRVIGLDCNAGCPSIYDAVRQAICTLVELRELPGSMKRRGWCIELRSADGQEPSTVVSEDPKPFYGLVTCDEGWHFVPEDVARTRLGNPWSTRTFVAVYPVNTGILCINNKDEKYSAHQRTFKINHFGQIEPYFQKSFEIAGLDHGPLLVLERALASLGRADYWLGVVDTRNNSTSQKRRTKRSNIEKGQLLRLALNQTSEMLAPELIAEVHPLERILLQNMGVEQLLDKLDRQVQAIDEGIRHSYESHISVIIVRLTIMTIVLTVVTIIVAVYQVMIAESAPTIPSTPAIENDTTGMVGGAHAEAPGTTRPVS